MSVLYLINSISILCNSLLTCLFSRVHVPQGQNPMRHARVASVETVGSWEGDHDYLQPLAARRGGARQETSLAVAMPQYPQQMGRMYSAQEVEQICERYAANERGMLQQQLRTSEQQLAESRRHTAQLEQTVASVSAELAAKESEIEEMSKKILGMTSELQRYRQQPVAHRPQVPGGQVARPHRQPQQQLPLRQAETRPQGRQQFDQGVPPFQHRPLALPAPPQQTKERPPQMALVPRPAFPPLAVQRAIDTSARVLPGPTALQPGIPRHPDDVFDPSVPNKLEWRTAQFEKRPLRSLLDASWHQIKGTIYNLGYVQIPHSRHPGEKDFIRLCVNHVQKPKMAYEMLSDPQRFTSLVNGVVISLFVDKIFIQTAMLDFPADRNGHVAALHEKYQVEKELISSKEALNDFERRATVAESRAEAARNLQRVPGFWAWTREKAAAIYEEVIPQVQIALPRNQNDVKERFTWAAEELIRIHVRMMTEKSVFVMDFPGTGVPWSKEAMINRDPKLMNEDIPDKKSPWVVQCAQTPVVIEEKFDKTPGTNQIFINKETISRAEVTLCDRKGNLRS